MADENNDLKCVILTLRRENVIVPNSLVAEIVSVKGVEHKDHMPSWYLGDMKWRGIDIPLLSYEAAAGEQVSSVNLNTQAVVLYAVGRDAKISEKPYLGLVMSGVPHVSRFTREQIEADEAASVDHPMLAQKVRINGASICVLDVDNMVSMMSGAEAA